MYNEELERLIELAIIDGELTEKEKQILFKKAESFGVDLDEFEMVLQAKLFEKQQSKKQAESPVATAPKSEKFGDIKKCPSCGAVLQSFQTKCGDCGYEFRNIEASQNIIKFFEKLDELESNRIDTQIQKSETHEDRMEKLAIWFFFWWALIPFKIITFFVKPAKWSAIDSRKEDLVLNFPIPTSREEILEFLTLASSRVFSNTYFNAFSEETKYKNRWNKIWLKKIEQISYKASLAMKNDKETLDEVSRLTEKARLIVKKNNKRVKNIALGFTILIVTLVTWGVISHINNNNKASQQKELKTKAEAFIAAGEYDKAEKIIKTLENESFIFELAKAFIVAGEYNKAEETIKTLENESFLFKIGEAFITAGEYDKAEEVITMLKDESYIVELKSKIQLEELSEKIDALEVHLKKKEYSKIKLELEKVIWKKNSKYKHAKKIEKEYYKVFLKKKEAINNQLPDKYKTMVEVDWFF